MPGFWSRPLSNLGLIALLALVMWPIAGAVWALLGFGLLLLGYIFFNLRQLQELNRWLANPQLRTVPEGEGLTPVTITLGDWPDDLDEVVIDSFAAEANDFDVGQVIDVITPVGVEPFRISGISTFGEADNLLGATVSIFSHETAQRIFEADDKVDSIAVVLEPGADVSLVQAQAPR